VSFYYNVQQLQLGPALERVRPRLEHRVLQLQVLQQRDERDPLQPDQIAGEGVFQVIKFAARLGLESQSNRRVETELNGRRHQSNGLNMLVGIG